MKKDAKNNKINIRKRIATVAIGLISCCLIFWMFGFSAIKNQNSNDDAWAKTANSCLENIEYKMEERLDEYNDCIHRGQTTYQISNAQASINLSLAVISVVMIIVVMLMFIIN